MSRTCQKSKRKRYEANSSQELNKSKCINNQYDDDVSMNMYSREVYLITNMVTV
jgi:hypothetical protein